MQISFQNLALFEDVRVAFASIIIQIGLFLLQDEGTIAEAFAKILQRPEQASFQRLVQGVQVVGLKVIELLLLLSTDFLATQLQVQSIFEQTVIALLRIEFNLLCIALSRALRLLQYLILQHLHKFLVFENLGDARLKLRVIDLSL